MKRIMKHFNLTIFIIMLASMVGNKSFAYDIIAWNEDNIPIYYDLDENKGELTVTYKKYYSQKVGTTTYNSSTGYEGVTSLKIPKTVTYMNRELKVTRIGHAALWSASLETISIPSSVTFIDKNGSGLYNLKTVIIQDWEWLLYLPYYMNLSSPNDHPFFTAEKQCGKADLVIPNGITQIASRQFYNCVNLKSITIPNTVNDIGNRAFWSCDSLSTIVSLIETPFDINEYAFSAVSYSNAILYVPIGSIEKYREAIGWKNFVNIIEGTPTNINSIEKEVINNCYYDLKGQSSLLPHKGINIIKINNSTTKKIYVR